MNETILIPELHDAGKLLDHDLGLLMVVGPDGRVVPARGGHVFEHAAWEEMDLTEPQNATWLGVRDHHHEALKGGGKRPFLEVRDAFRRTDETQGQLPPVDEAERFRLRVLLSLADKAAASQSRVLPPGGFPAVQSSQYERDRLWRPHRHGKGRAKSRWRPIATKTDLAELIAYLAEPPSDGSEFLRKYADGLLLCAEDKAPPRNLTSLYTHVRLVGQLFRILERHVTVDQQTYALSYGPHVANCQDDAMSKWPMRLVRVDIEVLQAPVKAKDLHVYALLENALTKVRGGSSRDYLLYAVGNTLWLLLPATDVAPDVTVESVLPAYHETYALRTTSYTLPLGDITPDVAGLRSQLVAARALAENAYEESAGSERAEWESAKDRINNRLQHVASHPPSLNAMYPGDIGGSAGAELEPDLCEICQLRHAPVSLQETTSYGGVMYLCEACSAIRNSADGRRLRTMARWEEQDEARRLSGRLAWIRLQVQTDVLATAVKSAFDDYIDRLANAGQWRQRQRALAKADLRPLALFADFVDDYVAMLSDLEAWVVDLYGTEKHVRDVAEWQVVSRERASKGQTGAGFFVLRVNDGEELYLLLEEYDRLLKAHFPALLDPCPVQIAVNLAEPKYPFYEHWRDLNRAQGEIWLHHPGTTVSAFKVRYLSDFLKLTRQAMEGQSRYLHGLAALEKVAGGSQILAEVTLQDDVRRRELPDGLQQFVNTMQAAGGDLRVSHLLAWYKLTTWRKGRK